MAISHETPGKYVNETRVRGKLGGMSFCMDVRGKIITLCACQVRLHDRDIFLTIMPVITVYNALQTFILTWPELCML